MKFQWVALVVVSTVALGIIAYGLWHTVLSPLLPSKSSNDIFLCADNLLLSKLNGSTQSPVNVLFVKTHKTGSSTVTGLLWRHLCLSTAFATPHNCFLPSFDNPGRAFDIKNPDHWSFIQSNLGTQQTGPPFSVWLSHTRYDNQLLTLMRQPILFISIVRRPAYRFQSAWHWYQLQKSVRGIQSQRHNLTLLEYVKELSPLSEHASTPGQYKEIWLKRRALVSARMRQDLPDIRGNYRKGLESMSQELTGLHPSDASFATAFARLLSDVRHFRKFLLVAERFEESVFLLHHLLREQNNRTIDTALNANTNTNTNTNNSILAETCIPEAFWYLPQKVQHYTKLPRTLYADLNRDNDSTAPIDFNDPYQLLDDLQPHDSQLYRASLLALDALIDLYNRMHVGASESSESSEALEERCAEPFSRDFSAWRDTLRQVQRQCDLKSTADRSRDSTDSLDRGDSCGNNGHASRTSCLERPPLRVTLPSRICDDLRSDNRESIQHFHSLRNYGSKTT